MADAPRFFVPGPLGPSSAGREIALPEPVAHHALRVLRLGDGDAIVLFDGGGGECDATLAVRGKREALARITRHVPHERESPDPVTLVQAIVAAEPMELVVRKAVELGVHAIAPVVAARSQNPQAAGRRLAHWRQVAIAACEQCGRNRVPAIAEPVPLAVWIAVDLPHVSPAAMLVPGAAPSLAAVAARIAPRALLIGPEGGWSEAEIRLARDAGIVAAHLGPRVLRAETAAIAALATMNAVVGDAR